MIFVTVGTHEQPFDRLMKEIDRIASTTEEEVIVQYGYSTYIPSNCKSSQMISSQDMERYTKEARIIITHGGPGSILLALMNEKRPIVLPRQKKFGEHVNDHQVDFTKHLEKEGTIIPIYDIETLEKAINEYSDDKIKIDIKARTKAFNQKFEEEVDKLFKGDKK